MLGSIINLKKQVNIKLMLLLSSPFSFNKLVKVLPILTMLYWIFCPNLLGFQK